MGIEYIINNAENTLTEQYINGSLSATTISGGTFYITSVGSGTPQINLGLDSNFQVVTGTTGGGSYTYEIGEYVADEGGVIAHRWLSTTALGSPTAGTVQNYLVVDTEDLTPTVYSLAASCPSANSSWNGEINFSSQSEAWDECANSTRNGKSDWYLPAIDELLTIYNNRWSISQGLSVSSGNQFLYDKYFSSTAYVICNILALNFLDGLIDTTIVLDGDVYNVRAVRKFSI